MIFYGIMNKKTVIKEVSKMNYWIFIVTEKKFGNEIFKAKDVFEQRMRDGFWGLGENTPNRKALSKGDKVIFYVGLPQLIFAGTATLASSCFRTDMLQKNKYGHGKQFFEADYGVLLEDIDVWSKPKAVKDVVTKLNFIENKEFWFTFFQGGIRQITEDDYRIIINEREVDVVEGIEKTKDLENQTEFVLETQLEEFIYANWNNIKWGWKLELYKTNEQNGRQFPAGLWSIDFLAVDKENNDLVVIELKRGKTSDATVGQILRYINWVKENIADKGQNVRGIIVAKEVDDALNYAVMNQSLIAIKTYKIDFHLSSFKN